MSKSLVGEWLANVSIARKLYFVVITMAILITFELVSLSYSINTLSAIRAYINGEGLWAKAQKDASYHLSRYAFTHDQKDYQAFLALLKVNLGDKKARIELNKFKADYALITQGLLEGRNDIRDIDGMIKLYRRFYHLSDMKKAISIWTEGDSEILRLQTLGLRLHKMLLSQDVSSSEINKTLIEIDIINNNLTKLEDDFSFTLGEVSRSATHFLLKVLLIIALTIEISVLMLTVLFTRRISKGIEDINVAARKISAGDFDAKISVNSRDEIGCLALTFNEMTDSLKKNIIRRKKSEASLIESEELFKSAFDDAPIGVCLVSLEGKFLRVNKGLCSITGYSATELLEKNYNEITYQDAMESGESAYADLISTGVSTTSLEKRYMHIAGHIIWVRLKSSLRRSIEGEPLYFIIQIEEITEHKKAEIKIHEQAALLDKAQDAIMVKNLDDKIIYWNKSSERLYGWKDSEVININASGLYEEKSNEFVKIKDNLLSNGEWFGELKQYTKYGNEIIVQSRWTLIFDTAGTPKSILVVNTDITEKKILEEQFYRSQRLESIGTLAAGIAHDLNNIFTPIMMSTHLLRMDLSENKRDRVLENLEETSQRGADIIKQLLFFGKGAEGNKTNIQLNQLITQMVTIISETFPKAISIEKNLPDSLWSVSGDSTQLQQVILNLCVNARDAILNEGVLKVTAENIVIDENYVRKNSEARVGAYVCIEVSDNGTGIPSEIINKIFDPFFTTKERGKGSGLGLSIIIGIVKNHGGFVTVDSQLSRGSKFKIFIPAIKSAQVEILDSLDLPFSKGNGELIMIVDDEWAIVEGARTILEEFGYKVITATNGLEALEKYTIKKEKIKVILTDLNMPVVDGFTLIKTLFELNSSAIIIASSGLLASIKNPGISDLNIKSFLQKPYTSENLLKKINEALN